MKRLYAVLSVIGYIASNWFVVLVSIESGNVLLWTRPLETMAGMDGGSACAVSGSTGC